MTQQTNPHLTRLADAATAAAENPGSITVRDQAINFVGTVSIPETETLFDASAMILYAYGVEVAKVQFVPYGTRPERLDVHVLWYGPEKKP